MKRCLESRYIELIQPSYFIETFSTEDDFVKWLLLGSREDIEACLKAFEEAEEYTWCSIIQRVLRDL